MSDEARPLISAIITSYNYAHYLDTSIRSVLGQDFPSFELIVIDNASTDDTDAVVAKYAHDPRFRYIKNDTNIGLTPNHNRGRSFARGEHIQYLSADDMILPGHFRRCYDYLQAHPAVDVLYTGALLMNADGEFIRVREMSAQTPCDYEGGRNELAELLSAGCYIAWPSMVVPRRLYDELGPMHDDFIASDYEIVVRWAAAGKRFAYLQQPSCAIRLHPPQASGTTYITSGRDLREFLTLLDMYVVPENYPRLRGNLKKIIAHLRMRAGYIPQYSNQPVEPPDAARVEATIARLEAIPDALPAADASGAPLISVIVRAGSLRELEGTLATLRDQVDAPPFETIVISEGGADLTAAVPLLPGHERLRYVWLAAPNAGLARNVGIRLAGGRIFTYLEPGSYYDATHLAALARAFAGGATVVRSNARLILAESADGTRESIHKRTAIAGLYRGEEDPDRDFVAPTVPIDTVAHVRDVLESTGPFRTDLPFGDQWDFWLRVSRRPVTMLAEASVHVAMLRGTIMPDRDAFFAGARQVYATWSAPPGSPPMLRRDAYLAGMTRWFERRAAVQTDDATMVQFIAELHGIAQPVEARA